MILGATREIAVLTGLLEELSTSWRWHRDAAAEAANAPAGPILEQTARDRWQSVCEMRSALRRLGAEPPAVHTPSQPTSPGQIEAMEARLRRCFEQALGAGGLSVPVVVLLGGIYREIGAARDQRRAARQACELVN